MRPDPKEFAILSGGGEGVRPPAIAPGEINPNHRSPYYICACDSALDTLWDSVGPRLHSHPLFLTTYEADVLEEHLHDSVILAHQKG